MLIYKIKRFFKKLFDYYVIKMLSFNILKLIHYNALKVNYN